MLAGNWSMEIQILATQNNNATLRRGDRGIRVDRLGFFKPFEDPEFLETTGLIRSGLKRNTPGKWLRSSRPMDRSREGGQNLKILAAKRRRLAAGKSRDESGRRRFCIGRLRRAAERPSRSNEDAASSREGRPGPVAI
jgi:hypothetical protein